MKLFGYEITIKRAAFSYFDWTVQPRGDGWTAWRHDTILNQPTLRLIRLAVHDENQRQRDTATLRAMDRMFKTTAKP